MADVGVRLYDGAVKTIKGEAVGTHSIRVYHGGAIKGIPTKTMPAILIDPDDTYDDDSNADTNYGGSTVASEIGYEPTTIKRAYFKFTDILTEIPAGATITSATFYFWVYNDRYTKACRIQRCTDDWAENTLTWNNHPALTAVGQADTISPSFGWNSIDVTDIIQWVMDNTTNYGFCMKQDDESVQGSWDIRLSEYDSPHRPYLIIDYTQASVSKVRVYGVSENWLDEDFEDITDWTSFTDGTFTLEENPAGQLHCLAGDAAGTDSKAVKYIYRQHLYLLTHAMLEVKVYFDVLGAYNATVYDGVWINFNHGTHRAYLYIFTDQIRYYSDLSSDAQLCIDAISTGQWYTYYIHLQDATMRVYRGTTLLATVTNADNYTALAGRIFIGVYNYSTLPVTTEAHFDYVKLHGRVVGALQTE